MNLIVFLKETSLNKLIDQQRKEARESKVVEGKAKEGDLHLKVEKEEELAKTEVADKAEVTSLAVEKEVEVGVGVVVVVVVVVERDTDQAVNQVTPVKIASLAAPAKIANQVRTANQATPARIVNQAIPARTVNRAIPARTVNQAIPAKVVNLVIPANPVVATHLIQVIAAKNRLRVTVAVLVMQASIHQNVLDLIRTAAIANYQVI